MNGQEIATIILSQLGGNKFIAMTGAKQLSYGKDNLQFKIGRNSSKANQVVITLNANDTYTMTFYRFAKMELKELKSFDGIYCDQLQELFTEYTGLYTSL